ncbi:hypothetical protein TNCV_2196391 [Trichonephila clavipes]|nr:hypothetical protein TNCV_2196391 [Trichonephila clavipes]
MRLLIYNRKQICKFEVQHVGREDAVLHSTPAASCIFSFVSTNPFTLAFFLFQGQLWRGGCAYAQRESK